MNNSTLRLLGRAALIASALFSCWLVWQYVLKMPLVLPEDPRNPDQFATALQVTVMDEAGHLAYQFFSPHVFHYPQNNRTFMVQPKLVLYNSSQAPWQLTADKGEAWFGDQYIYLQGNVIALQAASAANPTTMISTPSVTFYPKLRLVTGTEVIKAQQPPHGYLSGKGMRLDLLHQTLDLLSDVQGVYVPYAK